MSLVYYYRLRETKKKKLLSLNTDTLGKENEMKWKFPKRYLCEKIERWMAKKLSSSSWIKQDEENVYVFIIIMESKCCCFPCCWSN